MKNSLDGGEAILEAFRRLHIDYVISSPGSEWPSLWEAFARQNQEAKSGPTYIDCGHETLAVNIATAYTNITGKMQAVILHSGAGLLQGSMAIFSATALETPMVIMSGEALGYGETEFDPGSQWYRNLSIVGGTQGLVSQFVKFSQQIPEISTLFHSVTRAGEIAQRSPKGPTYLCVSMETMLKDWRPPSADWQAPPAPFHRPVDEDLSAVANMLASAERPVIIVENVGRDPEAYASLIMFAETVGAGVVEGPAAFFSNFPKDHPLYLGSDVKAILDTADAVVLADCRAPWYPPSNMPKDARIISIGEYPVKDNMVYQVTGAAQYLEGNPRIILDLLSQALAGNDSNEGRRKQRFDYWQQRHDAWTERNAKARSDALKQCAITVPFIASVLEEKLPVTSTFVDETIVYSVELRDQLKWKDSFGFLRAPSGLGQSLGYALGVKLAMPERTVVAMMGDGTFMYNPVIPALNFAKEQELPIIILVLDNGKYASMQHMHRNFYPTGVSSETNDYFGVNIQPGRYERAAEIVDGLGIRVEDADDLAPAIDAALDALKAGKSAILNIAVANYDRWTR